ncbi:hypothetical protein [Actinomadura fibrosa]|uniref:WD40 repeat domain-containing protein n=1 Tax=Actinomadura fibrosa TaxID=111802 RepID=A0ABW2XK23_9ACTN|nr:hypothetical protein [Actinomadura fibrosa]
MDREPASRSLVGAAWRSLIPVSVAAGVALCIGGGADVLHHRGRGEHKEHAAKPAARSEQTSPRFVVGVRRGGTALVVRDVRGGADVGLPVAAQPGRLFQRVSALKDGSYVVASYAARKVTFQRLELKASGEPKALKDLPKAAVPGISAPYSDLATGPDGERVAYVTYRGTAGRVDVVSTRTGARKTWTTKLPARISSLSWNGDTLAFVWSPLGRTTGRHQVRVLDTRLPSGDLKVSKAVLSLPKGAATAVLGRDGRTVVAGLAGNGQIVLQSYSIDTRKPARVVARQASKGSVARLDADHTGTHLLVSAGDGRLYAGGAAIPGADLADAAW